MEAIDLTRKPDIYLTSLDNRIVYALDFFPETISTIAPFDDEKEVHDFIIETLGEEAHKVWFPDLYAEKHATCSGCLQYKPERLLQSIWMDTIQYCLECRKVIAGK